MNDQDLHNLEQELRAMTPAALTPELLDQCELQLFGANLAAMRPAGLSTDQLDACEHSVIENELHSLAPRALEKSFLDQLEHIPAEVGLMELEPQPLSNEFLDKLADKLENADAPVAIETTEENVIPFPSATQKSPAKNWKWYASAAAVACIGIFTGLTLTNPGTTNSPLAANQAADQFQPISSDNLQNVSTESTFLQAQDRGIVLSNGSNPTHYRAVRVIQMETVTLKNDAGQTIQVQRPVEKTVLMPVEAD